MGDFFSVGKAGSVQCQSDLSTFLELFDDSGVPIKKEKPQLPTTVITRYGIEMDSNAMVARLPQDKLAKFSTLLKEFKHKRSVTFTKLQSLLGLLVFACSVIIPGRTFLNRLSDLTVGHTHSYYRITLNAEAHADLHSWHQFIEHFNGKSGFLFRSWVSSKSIKLYSDAAGVHGGFPAVFGAKWIVGKWTPQSYPVFISRLWNYVPLCWLWKFCSSLTTPPL